MNIGIIGTGLMGYPMAENISKKFKLKSYNRTFEKMKGLEKFGINLCRNIEDIFKDTEIIITMLPGDEEGDEMDLQAYYDAFNNQQTPIEEANES